MQQIFGVIIVDDYAHAKAQLLPKNGNGKTQNAKFDLDSEMFRRQCPYEVSWLTEYIKNKLTPYTQCFESYAIGGPWSGMLGLSKDALSIHAQALGTNKPETQKVLDILANIALVRDLPDDMFPAFVVDTHGLLHTVQVGVKEAGDTRQWLIQEEFWYARLTDLFSKFATSPAARIVGLCANVSQPVYKAQLRDTNSWLYEPTLVPACPPFDALPPEHADVGLTPREFYLQVANDATTCLILDRPGQLPEEAYNVALGKETAQQLENKVRDEFLLRVFGECLEAGSDEEARELVLRKHDICDMSTTSPDVAQPLMDAFLETETLEEFTEKLDEYRSQLFKNNIVADTVDIETAALNLGKYRVKLLIMAGLDAANKTYVQPEWSGGDSCVISFSKQGVCRPGQDLSSQTAIGLVRNGMRVRDAISDQRPYVLLTEGVKEVNYYTDLTPITALEIIQRPLVTLWRGGSVELGKDMMRTDESQDKGKNGVFEALREEAKRVETQMRQKPAVGLWGRDEQSRLFSHRQLYREFQEYRSFDDMTIDERRREEMREMRLQAARGSKAHDAAQMDLSQLVQEKQQELLRQNISKLVDNILDSVKDTEETEDSE